MRKPTTDAAKRAAGTYRPSTSRASAELVPNQPRMPASLTEPAKAVWRRVVPLLAQHRMIARLHVDSLVLYCESWARFAANPAEAKPALVAQLRILQSELGLSPSSTARVPQLEQAVPQTKAPRNGKVVSISDLLKMPAAKLSDGETV
jgi:phage terminase small subunit